MRQTAHFPFLLLALSHIWITIQTMDRVQNRSCTVIMYHLPGRISRGAVYTPSFPPSRNVRQPSLSDCKLKTSTVVVAGSHALIILCKSIMSIAKCQFHRKFLHRSGISHFHGKFATLRSNFFCFFLHNFFKKDTHLRKIGL